jgi:hypothetical protein
VAINIFGVFVALYRPPFYQDSGRTGVGGSRFARDDKELGLQLGKARNVRRKGAALLRGAEEQTARAVSAYGLYACLLSMQMGSMNKSKLDWRCDTNRGG